MIMNRREMIVTTGAALAVASIASAAAEKPTSPVAEKKLAATDKKSALIDTLAKCISAASACIAHCAGELASGNKSMGPCNLRVHEMLAVAQATLTLVSLDSDLAKRAAALCAEACQHCADACAEHKEHFAHGMHLACRDCMDACLATRKACDAYVA
jgi:Cys-rich four helix bundle protein (predicted Tat secretion target)